MSPNEIRSYRRARGPLNHPGRPIRTLLQETITAGNRRTVWHSKPPADAPTSIIDDDVFETGRPSGFVAEATAPNELFSSFMPDDLISTLIVGNTNVKIAELRNNIGETNRNSFTYSDTNLTEIKCFMGVLIMSGIRHDNHLSAKEMYSQTYGCAFYISLFSQKRFEFLIRAIRFEEAGTREERRRGDRFSLIRELWDAVIANCLRNW
ncbi:MAG: hypothetical protein GY800_07340, partial [Planctomycetes bacterium]|nr:hypothetical protein [Planctomycetota bacterium]